MRRLLALFRREDRGAVVIEFALCIPIMLMVVFAVIDFSRAYYTLNNLTSAAREGARVAAIQVDPGSAEALANTRAAVKQYAIEFGGQTVTDAQISVAFVSPKVTVTITGYQFQFITPLVGLIGGTNYTLVFPPRTAVFRWEREALPVPSA
jgi:Flp pilus assembly protein TadG